MNADPLIDHQRHLAAAEAHTAAIEAEMQEREGNFIRACRKLDANALADWAPVRHDASFISGPTDAQKIERRRYQTLAEVMRESLDYGGANDVSDTEVMQFFLNCAYGSDLANAPRTARILLERMARTFATNKSGLI